MQFTVGGTNNNMGATTGATQTTIAGQNGLPQAGLVDTTVGGNNMIGINTPSNNISVGGTNSVGVQTSPTGTPDLAAAAMAAINGINGGTTIGGATQQNHQAINVGATQPMVNLNQTVQTQQIGATAQVGQTNVMGGQTNMNQNGQITGVVGSVPNNGQGNITFNGNLSTIENALNNIVMGIGNLSNTILTAVILAAKGGVGGLNLGNQIQQTATPLMTQPATPQNNMFTGTTTPMNTSTPGIGGLPMTTTTQPQMQAVNPMIGTIQPQQMSYPQTTPINTTPMTGAMPQVQIGGMTNMMTTPMTTTPMSYQNTPNMFNGVTTPMTQPMMNNQMGGIPGMVATQPQMNTGGITGVRFATPAPQTTAMTTPLVGATNTGVFGTAMPQNNLGMINNQVTQPTLGFNTTPMVNNGLPQNILAATGTVQPQQMTAQPMVNPLVQHYNMMNMVTSQPQMMNYSTPGVYTQPVQPMETTPQYINPVQPQVVQPYAGYNTTPMMTAPVNGAQNYYTNPQQMVQPMMSQPQVVAYPQTGYMQQPTMGYHMGYRY